MSDRHVETAARPWPKYVIHVGTSGLPLTLALIVLILGVSEGNTCGRASRPKKPKLLVNFFSQRENCNDGRAVRNSLG